eukprot:COSAG01_NODE_467_length_16597_cov_10.933446_21_plen_133_part_00
MCDACSCHEIDVGRNQAGVALDAEPTRGSDGAAEVVATTLAGEEAQPSGRGGGGNGSARGAGGGGGGGGAGSGGCVGVCVCASGGFRNIMIMIRTLDWLSFTYILRCLRFEMRRDSLMAGAHARRPPPTAGA